ncbi:MAG TPA: hypothetical protein VH641_08735 [Streptosporangiaceae bacterium]|jgi:hypothetical protein
MYTQTRQVTERQRDLLSRACQERQVSQLKALRRASRRAERAERRLSAAMTDVLRARSELAAGS